MKTLSQSKLYSEFLCNTKLSNMIKSVVLERDAVDLKELEEPLTLINKKIRYATKNKILELVKQEKIIPIYNPDISLPLYLNTFGKSYNGQIKVAVDIKKYASMRSNDVLEIMPKNLYTLLQNGMIVYEMNVNTNNYINNSILLKNCAITYSKMFCKILDKLFAINIEPVKSDFLSFITAKYLLSNMCSKNNVDTVNNVAYTACYQGTPLSTILEEEQSLDINFYDDIFIFFNELKTINGLENLTVRSFIEQYARMYGEGTILGLDYFPSFLSVILSICISGNIHKDFFIDSVAGNYINKAFVEFCKLL